MSFPRFFIGDPKVKNTGFPITAFGNDNEESMVYNKLNSTLQ